MKNLIAVVLLAAGIAGCVSDQAYRTYVQKGTYPARMVSDVVVLNASPDQDFVVLADLQARGRAIASFKKVAASLGGDAVIVSKLGGYADDSTWADAPDGPSYTRIVGTVIKYKQGGK